MSFEAVTKMVLSEDSSKFASYLSVFLNQEPGSTNMLSFFHAVLTADEPGREQKKQ